MLFPLPALPANRNNQLSYEKQLLNVLHSVFEMKENAAILVALVKRFSWLYLLQQKKYAEATEALKKALELAPNTDEYKKLLEESVSRQQHQ